jgi:hypothetical protein
MSRPTHWPLKLAAFTAKKPPEGAPGGGRSKPTELDTQHVRTEEPDDTQGFFSSMTTSRSIHAATRPPWTPAHVDHRLNSLKPPCTQPTSIYKGWSDPRGGRTIPNRSILSSPNSSSSAPRAEPLREEYRELLPCFHRLPPLQRGGDLTGDKAQGSAPSDPLPNLSLTYYVTP